MHVRRGSVRASPVLGPTAAVHLGLDTGKEDHQSLSATCSHNHPTDPCLHLRLSPWGAATRQRRRPHTPIFYTTTLPSLTPQSCGRRDVSSLTQGWIVPWSMRRNFHVDQPCPCKWGWSVITIPVIFLGPCEVSFLQLS